MFEKEAEEYVMREDVITENDRVPFDNGYGFQTVSFEDEVKKGFQDGAEFGYNKANEWHYVKDGDLPKENQECYFICSNTYDKSNKVSFAKNNIKVRTGIYSFTLDEEGNQTTEPCFYDDVIGDEWGLSEVYAWKEIVLPELKESE